MLFGHGLTQSMCLLIAALLAAWFYAPFFCPPCFFFLSFLSLLSRAIAGTGARCWPRKRVSRRAGTAPRSSSRCGTRARTNTSSSSTRTTTRAGGSSISPSRTQPGTTTGPFRAVRACVRMGVRAYWRARVLACVGIGVRGYGRACLRLNARLVVVAQSALLQPSSPLHFSRARA
jgi:hypothetical protein